MFLFKCECGCCFTVKEETLKNITKNYHCQNCNTEMCHVIENYDKLDFNNSNSVKPIGVKIESMSEPNADEINKKLRTAPMLKSSSRLWTKHVQDDLLSKFLSSLLALCCLVSVQPINPIQVIA